MCLAYMGLKLCAKKLIGFFCVGQAAKKAIMAKVCQSLLDWYGSAGAKAGLL